MVTPLSIRLFHLVTSLLLVSSANSYTVCPSVCSCKWKNGKQTAECVGKGLTVIPAGINIGTQVIDLSRNNFHSVSSKVFQEKGLVNLQKIYLVECGVHEISEDAFFQLNNLIDLDLTSNNITKIPTQALKQCPLLRRLQLAHNPIREIEEGIFSGLTRLTFLDFSNCEIEIVHPGALTGLDNLEFLKLDNNHLSFLSPHVVQSLPHLFGLHLHNNPWYCDCRLRDIRRWMMENNVPLVVAPICREPSQVAGLTWDVMTLDDFACSPQIISSSTEVEVVKSHNATFVCKVKASPQASIYWKVGRQYINNSATNLEFKSKYYVEEDSEEIQSSRLVIIGASDIDGEVYMCFAENKAGNTSANFTLSVIPAGLQSSGWSSTQLSFVLIGILLALAIIVVIVCLVIFHPSALATGTKVRGVNVLKHFTSKKQDVVEMNDISNDREEKEFKAMDKQPRHETGSSGYGSDQLTPDLVSKIVDMNGQSLSTSTVSCNHPDQESITTETLIVGDQWSMNTKTRPTRYDDVFNRQVSEVYPNPCYSREDDRDSVCQASLQCPDKDSLSERCFPQNDRVRTLRGCTEGECRVGGSSDCVREDIYYNPVQNNWKRAPLVVSNANHLVLPAKSRFSPDEGYGEETLEGTEV